MNVKTNIKVAIAWHGMPTYAQAIINKLIKDGFNLNIISTKYNYCILDYKNVFINNIIIDEKKNYSWSELELEVPQILFKTGWAYQGFNSLANEVRRNGGMVVSLIDNSRKKNLRQFIGKYAFRILDRFKSEKYWVPGISGYKLLQYFGIKKNKIITGLYSADTNIFGNDEPDCKKKKQIVFVGQLIDRKNVLKIIEAFLQSKIFELGWSLLLVGDGPLRDQVARMINCNKSISYLGFGDPYLISDLLKVSKVLILASEEDHWGVVVHEAVLSGCLVVANNNIGAVDDLLNSENSIILKDASIKNIKLALIELSKYEDDRWLNINNISINNSKFNSIYKWTKKFKEILSDYNI